MSVLVDTSVLIDVLRGNLAAGNTMKELRATGPLHASEVTRLEVLSGMRSSEKSATARLLEVFTWHPVDERVSIIGGELGRPWIRSHQGIDAADLAIAATAVLLDVPLLTLNVKHFPMFEGLTAPY